MRNARFENFNKLRDIALMGLTPPSCYKQECNS